tara:strand:- start:53 stop:1777 length:1725 start_codon:yes stop_codon:yes gene_type:complete
LNWIGQHIVSLIARFRSDVYLEDISTGTIASGSHLGLDSNNKIVKAVDGGGDLTSIVAGTGLSGTSLTGPIPTLNVDANQTQITNLGTIIEGAWRGARIESDFLDTDTAHLTTTQVFTGDKTFSTKLSVLDSTASSAATGGKLNLISNDGAALGDDHRLGVVQFIAAEDASDGYVAGASIAAYADAAWSASENGTRLVVRTMDGNASGQDVLTLDSDKLATFTGDITVDNATASAANTGGILRLRSDDGAALGDDHRLGVVAFQAAEDGSSHIQTGAKIQAMADAAWSASENGTRLEFYTTDGNASQELSLTLDSDLLATFAGAVTVTGALSGTLATVSQPNITGVGTIGTGVWQGDAINATYLDGQSGTNTGDETLASINALDITEVGTISSGQWRGDAIASAYIDDDAVTEDKLANALLAEIDANTVKNSTPNIFGNYIKLLISDFATNRDGGNTKHGIGFDETITDGSGNPITSSYGIKVPNNETELYAFVSIPQGKTATHVDVYDKGDNLAFEVFEIQIDAATMVSKGTGNCNTTNNITDVASTATNVLAIKVTTVSVNNRIRGGRVTIA